MLDRFSQIDSQITRLEIARDEAQRRHSTIEQEIHSLQEENLVLEKVTALFKLLLEQSLYQHAQMAEDVVTQGLKAIFQDQDLSFKIAIGVKRNKISLDLQTCDKGIAGDALDSFGGGVAAVQGLLLRVLILMRNPSLAPYLLLDETLAALSKEYVPACASFLKRMCSSMNINILLVTHQPAFLKSADRAYLVNQDKEGALLLTDYVDEESLL